MKHSKRILALLLALLLVVLCGGCGTQIVTTGEKPSGIVPGKTDNALVKMAEEANVSLWFNTETCEMVLCDGETTYTMVHGELSETVVKAIATKLQSHLVVTYVNDSNATFEAISRVSSVDRGTYHYEAVNSGLRITFDFSRDRERFVIPVEYILEGKELCARVCTEDIVEYGENRIVSISFLPGCFSGFPDEEGELFLPDGSGSLVDFSMKNSKTVPLKLAVYGRDPLLSLNKVTSNTETVRVPVYGMIKNGNSVLAVLEEGSSLTRIVCNPSTASFPVCNVYPEFTYRLMDTVTLADQSYKARETTVISEVPEKSELSVRFLFETGKNGYEALALRYREYLFSGRDIADSRRIFVETYGAVKKTTSSLGFIYDKLESMTTFDQLEAIQDVFKADAEVPITYLLQSFHKKGYGGGYTKDVKIPSVLGGKDGLKQFMASLEEQDAVYLGGEFACDNSVKLFNKYAKNLYNESIARNQYSLSMQAKLYPLAQPLLKCSEAIKIANSYIQSAQKLMVDGFYFCDIGSELYSDYDRDEPTSREEALLLQKELLTETAQIGDVAIRDANVYTLGAASAMLNVPVESSRYSMEERSVPFLQVALSGLTALVSSPLNGEADMEATFITATALGMSLQFQLTGEENNFYKSTRASFLYNTGYAGWQGEIKEYTAKFSLVAKALEDSVILSCETPRTGVYRVTYSNGRVILANAGNHPYEWNGQTLPAYSLQIL